MGYKYNFYLFEHLMNKFNSYWRKSRHMWVIEMKCYAFICWETMTNNKCSIGHCELKFHVYIYWWWFVSLDSGQLLLDFAAFLNVCTNFISIHYRLMGHCSVFWTALFIHIASEFNWVLHFSMAYLQKCTAYLELTWSWPNRFRTQYLLRFFFLK